MKTMVLRKAINLKSDELLLVNGNKYEMWIYGNDFCQDKIKEFEACIFDEEFKINTWRVVSYDSIFAFINEDIVLQEEIEWNRFDEDYPSKDT